MTPKEIQQAIEKLKQLWSMSKIDEAKLFAIRLLETKDIQEYPELLTKIYNLQGAIHVRLSDFQTALECFENAVELNRTSNNKEGIARDLGNLGLVYSELYDYSKALEYYSKALLINEEIGNKEGIAINIGNIGDVYFFLSDYQKALEYYQKALQLQEEINFALGIANNLRNIGLVYGKLLDFPRSIEYYKKALKISEKINDKTSISLNISSLGVVYANLLDYSNALECFQTSLQLNEEIGNKENIALNISNIAGVFLELTDYAKAIENLNKAYYIASEIESKKLQLNCLESYSQIYEKIGEIENAFTYFKQFITLKEELQSEESKNQAIKFDQKRRIEEDEKNRQIKLARFKEQELIFHNILPISIANRLIEGEKSIAETYENVSIFFSDIVGFTTISSTIAPTVLVQALNKIFTAFDRIGTTYGLEKIKTIGDAYMAVCGVPEAFDNHQYRASQFAVEAVEVLKNLELGEDFKNLQIRIGLHCGSVVAGIIGEKKFAYDVWGDAVNIASRMESHSEPGRIHISEQFAKSIESNPEFSIIPRGTITIKGKGTMNTFWLEKGK